MNATNVGGRDRIARAALAVTLGIVTLLALRGGNRPVAAATAVGTIALAINAVTCFCGLNAALGIDTTTDD